jgi:TP901 family phage tail tape measure protein
MSTKNETATVEIIIKGQRANASMKDMEASVRQLRAQLRRLPADSQEFADKSKELAKVNSRLHKIREDIKGTGSMFQWLGKQVKAFGVLAVAALGFQWLTSQVSNIIRGNAELSDSLADVRKTTGMTAEEARRLNTSLSQLDTRTSTKELRQIAIAAGQLGIAKNDVLKFTAATDKMVVALGDEFTGGAEEVTKVMGGLRAIFKDIQTDKIDQDMLRIGNAINELASAGAATGPITADFANRIGSVGVSLGLTSGQVLGLSATLEELKVGTEKGGTATVKILQRMTTHIKEFAGVANMDVQDFADLVNTDLFGAFGKVLEGAQKSGASATALGAILDNLGVDGAGASEVVTKLGSNMKLLQEKVLLANGALKSTDSIMAEFKMKNSTLGAEMDRLSKGVAGAFTNSAVANGLKSMIGWLADVFDRTKKVSRVLEEERKELMLTEAEILTYNVGNETRTKLIKELQEKYPAYLKNIDAETVSQQELSEALARVNDNLVNKIILQKQDEKLSEQLEEQADAQIEAGEARVKVLENIARIYEYNQKQMQRGAKVNLKEELGGLPLEVQVQELLKADTYTGAGLSRFNKDIESLRTNVDAWRQAEIALSSEKMKSNDLDSQKQELLRALGISIDDVGTKTQQVKEKTKEGFVDPDQLKKDQAELDRLRAKIKELMVENTQFSMDDYERELDNIRRSDRAMRADINKRIKSHKERNEALKVLDEHTLNEQNAVHKKYTDMVVKEQYEALDKIREDKDAHDKAYHQLTSSTMQLELEVMAARFDEEINYRAQNAEEVKALEEAKEKALQEIRDKYASRSAKAQDKDWKQQVDRYRDLHNQMAGIVQSHQQLEEMKQRQEAERDDLKYDHDLTTLQRQLDRKVISQAEYDERLQLLDADKQNRERVEMDRRHRAEKDAARYSATLNLAEAVMEIWSKHAAYPPVAAALTALAGGAYAFQMATINEQDIPAYAGGGMVKPDGFVTDTTLLQSSSGMPFIAGERGAEWVAPNWMLQDPVTANQIGALEEIRQQGSSAGARAQSGAAGMSGSGGNAELARMLKANLLVLQRLERNGVMAKLNYDLFQKEMSDIEGARNGSRV